LVNTKLTYLDEIKDKDKWLWDATENQKIHIDLIPAYKLINKNLQYVVFVGFHIINDVSHTLGEKSIFDFRNPLKWGLGAGNELIITGNNDISCHLKFSYLTFQRSKIQYSNWPSIQHHHFLTSIGLGVVYSYS
jgi:hypothetical protein